MARRSVLDNCAEGGLHAVACDLKSIHRGAARGEGVSESGPSAFAGVLEGDGLDVAAEECMGLVNMVESGVELRDDGVGFVGSYDDFDGDFLVLHRDPSDCDFMPRTLLRSKRKNQIRLGGGEDGAAAFA